MVPRLAEEAIDSVCGDQAAAQTTAATTVMAQNQTDALLQLILPAFVAPSRRGGPCLPPGLERGRDS